MDRFERILTGNDSHKGPNLYCTIAAFGAHETLDPYRSRTSSNFILHRWLMLRLVYADM